MGIKSSLCHFDYGSHKIHPIQNRTIHFKNAFQELGRSTVVDWSKHCGPLLCSIVHIVQDQGHDCWVESWCERSMVNGIFVILIGLYFLPPELPCTSSKTNPIPPWWIFPLSRANIISRHRGLSAFWLFIIAKSSFTCNPPSPSISSQHTSFLYLLPSLNLRHPLLPFTSPPSSVFYLSPQHHPPLSLPMLQCNDDWISERQVRIQND